MDSYVGVEKKKASGKVIQKKSIRDYTGQLHNLHQAHSVNLISHQVYGGINRPEILCLTIPAPPHFLYRKERRANLISQHVSGKAAEIGSDVSAALATVHNGWNDWGAVGNQDTLDEFNVIYSAPWLGFSAEQEFNRLANGYMRHAVITNGANVEEYRSNGAHALDEQQKLFEAYNGMTPQLQLFVRNVARVQINFAQQTNPLAAAQLEALRAAIRKVQYQEALADLVGGILDVPGQVQQNFSRQLRERAGGSAERIEIINRLNQHTALTDAQIQILNILLVEFGQILPGTIIDPHAHATVAAMSLVETTNRAVFRDQHSELSANSVNDAINTVNSGHAADALSMAIVEAARFAFLRGRIGRMRTNTWLIFHQRAIKLGELFTNYSNIVASTGVNINNPGWERYGLTSAQVNGWVAVQAMGPAPVAAGEANGVQNQNWAKATGDFCVII